MTTNEITTFTGTSATLFSICQSLFDTVLLHSSKDDSLWNHRQESFRKLSMLEFLVPSLFTPKPYDIDEERLEDGRYRRQVIRKLKAPRPGKWSRQFLHIDQSRMEDETYRSEMATVLAYRFMLFLTPLSDEMHVVLPLIKMSVEEIEYALDVLALNTIDSVNLAKLLLTRLANKLIDKNPTFIKVESELKAEMKAIGEELRASMKEIADKHRAEFGATLDGILSEVRRSADETIAGIKERMSESAKRTQAVLDEEALYQAENGDLQAAFVRDVKAREAKGDKPWLRH